MPNAKREIVFSPEAKADLIEIYDYIALASNAVRAMGFIGRIERTCHSLSNFPQRGTLRDDVRPGLRVVGFERRVSIAFAIGRRRVTILRVLYGGRDLNRALSKSKS
ncbi:MAG TPA: type II toxin-antitoxin system RelE/ParE family toxin [Rhizomicrobium sp.]